MKDQHEYIDGDNRYLITAFGATYGLEVMNKLGDFSRSETSPSAGFIKGVILHSVTHNSKVVDEKWFDSHFSRKYVEVQRLFSEIIKFNFGETGEDGLPNGEEGSSE
jgi:hypothetical protein